MQEKQVGPHGEEELVKLVDRGESEPGTGHIYQQKMTSGNKSCKRHVRPVVLLLGCMVINFTVISLARGTGVLFVAMLEKFGTSKSATSLIMSIFVGIMFGGGLIAGLVCTKVGARLTAVMGTFILAVGLLSSAFVDNLYVMYVTYGVIGGLGGSFSMVAVEVTVQQNFENKRALAAAVSTLGKATGVMVQPILNTAMVTRYGLKEALYLAAAMVFFACLTSFTFKFTSKTERKVKRTDFTSKRVLPSTTRQCFKQNDETDLRSRGEESSKDDSGLGPFNGSATEECNNEAQMKDDCQARKPNTWCAAFSFISRNYILFITSTFFACLSLFTPFNFIPAMMTNKGFAAEQISLVLSVAGPADIFGKLAVGLVADHRLFNRHWCNVLCLVLAGAMTIGVVFFEHLYQFVCYSVVYGLSAVVWVFLQPVLVVDIVGKQNVEHGIGINLMLTGIGGSIGLPVAGWLVDVTGSFYASLLATGCVFVLAGVIAMFIPLPGCFNRSNEKPAEEGIKPPQISNHSDGNGTDVQCLDIATTVQVFVTKL